MTRTARLQEAVLRAVLHTGWPGVAGVTLLAFGLAFGIAADSETDTRRRTLAAERDRILRPAQQAEQARPQDRDRIERYYAVFPSHAELPARLDRLHALAEARGLGLTRAAYRSGEAPDAPLERVTLTLPAEGEFAALYAWLAEVLREMPELGLESLAVKRADAESAVVRAELRLVLFAKRPGSDAARPAEGSATPPTRPRSDRRTAP